MNLLESLISLGNKVIRRILVDSYTHLQSSILQGLVRRFKMPVFISFSPLSLHYNVSPHFLETSSLLFGRCDRQL